MSLDSGIIALATAIGEEIKDVRADMALMSGGSGGGTQSVFIQETEPAVSTGQKALWIDTTGGNLNFWLKTGE